MSHSGELLDVPPHKKSSYCASNACLEVALQGEYVSLRDSDFPNVELLFDEEQWDQITGGLGELASGGVREVVLPLEDETTVAIIEDDKNHDYPWAVVHSDQPGVVVNYKKNGLRAFVLGACAGEFAYEALPQLNPPV